MRTPISVNHGIQEMTTYKLHITEEEMSTIDFVGYRYGWSHALQDHCVVGDNNIPEHIAWEIKDAIEEDDALFPMLDPRSSLYEKLITFWEKIV